MEIKEFNEEIYVEMLENGELYDYITNLQQKIKHYEETTTFGDYVKEVNLLVDYKSRIEKAVEILKDTNVDMPSTLLIETIDNGINILEN